MPRNPTGQPRGPRPRGVHAATERITVRFSERELRAVQAAAQHYSQSVAVYVADCALLRANQLADRLPTSGN